MSQRNEWHRKGECVGLIQRHSSKICRLLFISLVALDTGGGNIQAAEGNFHFEVDESLKRVSWYTWSVEHGEPPGPLNSGPYAIVRPYCVDLGLGLGKHPQVPVPGVSWIRFDSDKRPFKPKGSTNDKNVDGGGNISHLGNSPIVYSRKDHSLTFLTPANKAIGFLASNPDQSLNYPYAGLGLGVQIRGGYCGGHAKQSYLVDGTFTIKSKNPSVKTVRVRVRGQIDGQYVRTSIEPAGWNNGDAKAMILLVAPGTKFRLTGDTDPATLNQDGVFPMIVSKNGQPTPATTVVEDLTLPVDLPIRWVFQGRTEARASRARYPQRTIWAAIEHQVLELTILDDGSSFTHSIPLDKKVPALPGGPLKITPPTGGTQIPTAPSSTKTSPPKLTIPAPVPPGNTASQPQPAKPTPPTGGFNPVISLPPPPPVYFGNRPIAPANNTPPQAPTAPQAPTSGNKPEPSQGGGITLGTNIPVKPLVTPKISIGGPSVTPGPVQSNPPGGSRFGIGVIPRGIEPDGDEKLPTEDASVGKPESYLESEGEPSLEKPSPVQDGP